MNFNSLSWFRSIKLPTFSQILNTRFFYCLLVNSLIYALSVIYGGGGIDLENPVLFVLKGFVATFILLSCLFYFTSLFTFLSIGIIIERLLCLIYFLVAIVEIFLVMVFGTLMNMSFFSVFLATNTQEVQEFLSFYLAQSKVFGMLVGFIIGSFMYFIFIRHMRWCVFGLLRTLQALLNSKIFTLLLCCMTFVFMLYKIDLSQMGFRWFINKNIILAWINIIKDTPRLYKSYTNYAKRMDSTRNIHLQNEHVVLSNQAKESPINIVLIIGESTQRNYMSLYGYPLSTTPHLDNLAKNDNLVVFKDVISPNAHTDAVIPKLLTFSHYENGLAWVESQNLFDVLHLAGYRTYWLSNQEFFSIHSSATYALYSIAQNIHFTGREDSYNAGRKFDEALLPILDSAIAESRHQTTQNLPQIPSKNKNFYFIHLIGTHGSYKQRYPKEFKHFTPESLHANHLDTLAPYPQHSTVILTESQLETKTHYLNAILYNDFIVSEIFKRFNDENTLVIYLSDHGDEMYDFRDFAGHAENIASRFMVEIPFMVYVNNSFKKAHSTIVARLEHAKDRPFMSDDFIHSILDLLGISSKDFVESRSLFSPKFNDTRERISSGKNYDTDLKDKSVANP